MKRSRAQLTGGAGYISCGSGCRFVADQEASARDSRHEGIARRLPARPVSGNWARANRNEARGPLRYEVQIQRAQIPLSPGGLVEYVARANAIKGRVPRVGKKESVSASSSVASISIVPGRHCTLIST